MRIIGPDELVFGVDDLDACRQFLLDSGLIEAEWSAAGGTFVGLDNTGITVRARDDASLPAALASGATIRQTIYGCEDQATVDAIETELGRDREVVRSPDGSITCSDDVGIALKFQVTKRKPFTAPPELVNSPGAAPARGFNVVGANEDAVAVPRTLSHLVYFSPDMDKQEAFYVERLRFVVTDRFTDVGPFLRPAACTDHHTLFMVQTPPHMQGMEHFAFHMQGPTELMLAGTRMLNKGWESFWGPGRHKFGSNWFWYFNCPLMTHFEFDADMDLHDNEWVPRETEVGAPSAQMFLFEGVEKWFPSGPPPEGEDHH